jgi:Ribbon-helix-helix protein, copG family
MSRDNGLKLNGMPRKRYGLIVVARVPTSLVERVKAKAKARNVAYSVVIREALDRYVESGEGRDRGARPSLQETDVPALDRSRVAA